MGLKPVELITLGKMKPGTLFTILFYTGIIGLLYPTYQFGRYIAITNNIMRGVKVDQGMYAIGPTSNSILGFFAGFMCFLVFFVIWKVTCEFLLMIYTALSVYVYRQG